MKNQIGQCCSYISIRLWAYLALMSFVLAGCHLTISAGPGGNVHQGTAWGSVCSPECFLDTSEATGGAYFAIADAGYKFDHWEGASNLCTVAQGNICVINKFEPIGFAAIDNAELDLQAVFILSGEPIPPPSPTPAPTPTLAPRPTPTPIPLRSPVPSPKPTPTPIPTPNNFIRLDADGVALEDQTVSYKKQAWSCARDLKNGRVWEVKSNDGGIHDQNNAYRWGGATVQSVDEGMQYLDWDTLVEGSNSEQLCGRDDWRVPSMEELHSLVDLSNDISGIAIEKDSFPNAKAEGYWSAISKVDDEMTSAWFANFTLGILSYNNRDKSLNVRLVASEPVAQTFTKLDVSGNALVDQEQDYATQAWSCVKDNSSGLTWEVKTTFDGIHGQDTEYRWGNKPATPYKCGWMPRTNVWTNTLVNRSNSQALCGYTDWRVPSIKELYSIVDLSSVDVTINTDYFPHVADADGFYKTFWSSGRRSCNVKGGCFWLVHFIDGKTGLTGDDGLCRSNRVRLVRGSTI